MQYDGLDGVTFPQACAMASFLRERPDDVPSNLQPAEMVDYLNATLRNNRLGGCIGDEDMYTDVGSWPRPYEELTEGEKSHSAASGDKLNNDRQDLLDFVEEQTSTVEVPGDPAALAHSTDLADSESSYADDVDTADDSESIDAMSVDKAPASVGHNIKEPPMSIEV